MEANTALILPTINANANVCRVDEAADSGDGALVRCAQAGVLAAFETLYRRHVARVHAVLYRLSGRDTQRAEEWTQDAFVRAWQKLSGFRHESAFGTWLHRIAVNTALMDIRARVAKPETSVDDDDLDQIVEATPMHCAGERADLERAVAGLPPRARAVLVLHDVEGWRHEDIALELGMAVGSSKAQLHRARQLLRRILGESDE